MKTKLPLPRRHAITAQVEMYTPKRVREFDGAERELAACLATKSLAVKRIARSKRKSSR